MAKDSLIPCGVLGYVILYGEGVDSASLCGSRGCETFGAAEDSWSPAWGGGSSARLDSWTCPGSQGCDSFLWAVGSGSCLCRGSSASLSLDFGTTCVNHSWGAASHPGYESPSEGPDSCLCCAWARGCETPSWVVGYDWRIFWGMDFWSLASAGGCVSLASGDGDSWIASWGGGYERTSLEGGYETSSWVGGCENFSSCKGCGCPAWCRGCGSPWVGDSLTVFLAAGSWSHASRWDSESLFWGRDSWT